MTDTIIAPRPFFEITGLKFRIWPIVLAYLLGEGIMWSGRWMGRTLFKAGPESWDAHIWWFVCLAEIFQLALAVLAILAMRRLLPQADSHLRWPPGKSYAGTAIVIGIAIGLIMLVADYWPDLIRGAVPEHSYSTDPVGAAGWLVAMLGAGPNEETLFRGLLVGMLVVLVPGRIRAGRFEIPVAGVIVALMFAVAHWRTFLVDPLHLAIAQQLYAIAWGLIYVWLMERSRSLLAPAIAHGLGNAVEVGAVMLITIAWS